MQAFGCLITTNQDSYQLIYQQPSILIGREADHPENLFFSLCPSSSFHFQLFNKSLFFSPQLNLVCQKIAILSMFSYLQFSSDRIINTSLKLNKHSNLKSRFLSQNGDLPYGFNHEVSSFSRSARSCNYQSSLEHLNNLFGIWFWNHTAGIYEKILFHQCNARLRVNCQHQIWILLKKRLMWYYSFYLSGC